MKDVFYFTKSTVNVSDLALAAHEAAYSSKMIETCDGQDLKIYGHSGELLHCIAIDPMGRDYATFETPQQEKISALQPRSGFIISYHLPSRDVLLVLLKRLFERYGGWVGGDDNTFETIYTAENVEAL